MSVSERTLQALSAVSSIWLVEHFGGTDDERYECRRCLLLALDCSRTAFLPNRRAALDHLEEHAARGETGAGANGAKDAIGKLEQCPFCRGAGRVRTGLDTAPCAACGQTGKNEIARARAKEKEVRRGTLVR